MMEQLPRAWDANWNTDTPSHRQHSLPPASALRYTSHGPDRQASLNLDFLIVGGGSSYDLLRTCSQPNSLRLHQGSPDLLLPTRWPHQGIVCVCLSKRRA